MDQEIVAPQAAPRRWKRWQAVVLIVFLGMVVRAWAAWQLPIDYDEPTYLNAGYDYAQMIKSGNWQGIINYDYNQEHPPLVKLMDSLSYLFFEPKYGSTAQFYFDRGLSVFWGTLAVLILALIDPWAGLFLAMDSMVIKYTSQVYLEALPLFFTLLAIFSFRRSYNKPGLNRWFWISAIALGIAIAGKYLYAAAGLSILALLIFQKKYQIKDAVVYGLAALLAFWAFDPHLWIDPLNRLYTSLTFHLQYTQGADVLRASYPWYQALNWITGSVPWHPEVFFFPTLDFVIFILALAGIVFAWRKNLWIAIWGVTNFLVLLAWPTKWPQYTLILIPALCLLAAAGLRWLVAWFQSFEDYWQVFTHLLPRPGKIFWGALILFVAALGFGKLAAEIQRFQGRLGWQSVQADVSPLPSNFVNDIAAASNGQVALATDKGLSFWMPTQQSPWGDTPQTFTPQNSGLADLQVNVVLRTGSMLTGSMPAGSMLASSKPAGSEAWWIGTQNGLNYYDPAKGWKTWHGPDMGLSGSQVNTLAEDELGNLWVGTNAGAAFFDGQWKTYTAQNSGLGDNSVFSIAIEPGKAVWFGHLKGVSRMDLATGKWTQFDLSKYGFGWGGTVSLIVDHQDRIWAGTLGSGLNMWDGKAWTNYMASNSGLPQNNVNTVLEDANGVLWIGCSYSTSPGGMLASFDGKNWKVYDSTMTGFSGFEPNALALDQNNELWIGTRGHGVDIFQTSP